MWNKLFKNEQGFTLVITILAIMLISILGLSLMTTTANSKKISKSEYVDQSAYYIAEAGLTLAINTIDSKIMAAKNNAETKFSDPNETRDLEELYTIQLESLLFNDLNSIEDDINNYSDFNLSNTKINIDISKTPDMLLTIISTGSIDGQKRTVKQEVNIYPLTPPPSYAAEIESAIRRDLIGKLGSIYTIKGKSIFLAETDRLNASNGVIEFSGDHFKGWTFVFEKGLNMKGIGAFITSAKIEVQGNLEITGSKACLLTYDTEIGSLIAPGHHPENNGNALYIEPHNGKVCNYYKNHSGNDTPTPTPTLYEKSQPVEINNPS